MVWRIVPPWAAGYDHLAGCEAKADRLRSGKAIRHITDGGTPVAYSWRPQDAGTEAHGATDTPGTADRLHDDVIGRLYDVALDPLRLADLLDDWEHLNRPLRRALDRAMAGGEDASGHPDGDFGSLPDSPRDAETLASPDATLRQEMRRGGALDFTDHFQRVTRLLEQTSAAHVLRPEETELRRFARTAAFAVGSDLRLSAANEAARHGLGVKRGDPLDSLPLEVPHLEALRGRLRRMLSAAADPVPERARRPAARPGGEAVLRLRLAGSGQLFLAQLALNRPGGGRSPFVLVVTSQLRWPEALTETLRDAYKLTRAEAQILRSLSEARPLRDIAEERGRSVETVRAQIKAILAKTETRSQGELLRLALSVSELVPALPGPVGGPIGARPAGGDTPRGLVVAAAPAPANPARRSGNAAPIGATRPRMPSQGKPLRAPHGQPGTPLTGREATPMVTIGPLANDPAPAVPTPSGGGGSGMVRFSHAGGLLPLRPYRSLSRPGGRRMEYLVLGDSQGRAMLWTHGTYGQCRWPAALEAQVEAQGLCLLVPIRAGFGGSDPAPAGCDRARLAAEDMLALLEHHHARQVPVLAFGDDLHSACLLAATAPERDSALIGVSSSLPIYRAEDYDSMGRWHRFLLGGARYTPELFPFMMDTVSAMAKRMGGLEFLATLFAQSAADSATIAQPECRAALLSGTEIALDGSGHFLPALAGEIAASARGDWRADLEALKGKLPIHVMQGGQSLRQPASLRAAARRTFPWIAFREIAEGGELLHLQAGAELLELASGFCLKR